jgi:anti-sigma factor ChrR (cupin superfamily)
MLSTLETSLPQTVNSSADATSCPSRTRKQRVTITLPLSLLERLRNAVYWTGHGPLASLICDALDDAVTQMEAANGQTFPQRLAPLKRGRPRMKTRPAPIPSPSAILERLQ